MYQIFNKDVVQGLSGFGTLYSHINILETQYKINKKNTVRTELQHLLNKKDDGSWAMALIEYTVSPHWFFALIDQYNYENPRNSLKEVHYVSTSIGYIQNATRIALSYGKQREGFLCVGGVCRQIPASNGFGVSITSTF
jgi:flagellin-specific chaperone FliS